MHDIDRVRLETQSEAEAYNTETLEAEQFEFAEAEYEGPYIGERGEVFGESENMELASELLEVTNEAELDRFLGRLISSAGRALGSFVHSPEGAALAGALKGAAKKVLPALGSAVGGYLGGSTGANLGTQAAAAAGRAFGLELEGLSGEDREFEIARRYVNFAGEAVKNLTTTQPGNDPRNVANAAVVAAAQSHAPGLLDARSPSAFDTQPSSLAQRGLSGRWVRRGAKIILYGV